MWVRELSRIDRDAAANTHFRWADDGPALLNEDAEEVRPSFPAIYCRHCGRSGWGIGLAPVGLDLSSDDDSIRRNHAVREGRFRALIYAPTEAFVSQDSGEDVDGLAWFSIRERALLTTAPDELEKDVQDGWVLPILMLDGRRCRCGFGKRCVPLVRPTRWNSIFGFGNRDTAIGFSLHHVW